MPTFLELSKKPDSRSKRWLETSSPPLPPPMVPSVMSPPFPTCFHRLTVSSILFTSSHHCRTHCSSGIPRSGWQFQRLLHHIPCSRRQKAEGNHYSREEPQMVSRNRSPFLLIAVDERTPGSSEPELLRVPKQEPFDQNQHQDRDVAIPRRGGPQEGPCHA